jgi:PAS domain S-box-containing protein
MALLEEDKSINESGQTLKAILDGIGEGISIIDEDMKIVWVNPIIEKWAGRLEDIKGKNCYKVYQKRDFPCKNCPSVKTFKTGKIEKARQFSYDTKGNIKYFEFTSAPMEDERGRTIAVVELAVDLTEKIKLEHKLKVNNDKLQAIFDNIGDGISVIDKDYQILRVNQGVLKLFDKRDFSGLQGKNCFSEYHKNEAICDNCPAKKSFKEGRPYHVTRVCQGIDMGRIVLDISTFPIKDKNGKVTQVIEYMKNITDIFKLEDQLLYQERLAGIGELAAGIAHEIRNPLGSITASSQFVLGKYKLPELVKKHLKIIIKNSENANRIIMDLLDFAKPREISFKPGHIGGVINSACNLVKARCAKQRVRLKRKWSRRIPHILLDEKQLEQAFLNFILNALDAMPSGGRLMINANLDFQTKDIIVSFLDTGCGINPENLNKLFTPFFSTKEEGVGLGLYLAYQIISYHKGRINIESKLGQGAEVIVRLPFQRETDKEKEGSNHGNNPNS